MMQKNQNEKTAITPPKRFSDIVLPQNWLSFRVGKKALSKASHSEAEEEFVEKPSRELYELVGDMNLNRAFVHCQKSPLDASFQDSESLNTPLHLACRHRPGVKLVRALLEAYPDANTTRNDFGELPLHIACRFNASIDVLRVLAKANTGTAIIRTKEGSTSINYLWDARDTTERKENYLTVFWQKVQLILEAVARYRQEKHRRPTECLYILHAAVSLPECPDSVLRYAFHANPEQIKQRDGSDRLPIHIAVSTVALPEKIPSQQFLKNRARGEAQQAALERYANRADRDIAKKPDPVISFLLEKYPEAAREHDLNEHPTRLPIHTALMHQHQWHGGVRELFERAPEAIHVVDPIHKVYPFQLAALPASDNQETADLDSIFHLLRVQPATLDDLVRSARHQSEADAKRQESHRRAARRSKSTSPFGLQLPSINTSFWPASDDGNGLAREKCALSPVKEMFVFPGLKRRDSIGRPTQRMRQEGEHPKREGHLKTKENTSKTEQKLKDKQRKREKNIAIRKPPGFQKAPKEVAVKKSSSFTKSLFRRRKSREQQLEKFEEKVVEKDEANASPRQLPSKMNCYERQKSWDYAAESQSGAKVASLLAVFGK